MASDQTPPLPPDVRKQQQPALAQYAEGAMKQGGGGEQGGKAASAQLVMKLLAQISASMSAIANVISVEKPALMPVLTRMAGMGKVLEQQMQQASQGQGSPMNPGQEPAQASGDVPEGPDAMGA